MGGYKLIIKPSKNYVQFSFNGRNLSLDSLQIKNGSRNAYDDTTEQMLLGAVYDTKPKSLVENLIRKILSTSVYKISKIEVV